MIELWEASPNGIPRLFVCTCCGTGDPDSVWRQTEDGWSRTLPAWIRTHYRRSRNDKDRPPVLAESFSVPRIAPLGNGNGPAGDVNGHPPCAPAGLLIVKERLRRA